MPPRDDLLESRFAIAVRVASDLLASTIPAPRAIGVVGSTALGRCSHGSDLDLVAILAGAHPGPRVTSCRRDGVRVDVEWLAEEEALADTAGDGWSWELRKAARLGSAVPLYDPAGLFDMLRARSAAMRPDADRFAGALRAIEPWLEGLERGEGVRGSRGEALRGVLDSLAMLVLLRTPRRFQKAKWTIDDLVAADQTALATALLTAYGARDAPPQPPIGAVRTLLEAILARIGAPDAATLVAMGYAPDHAAASYVARALDDADDLARCGRFAEAHYAAGFAARLAAGLLGAPTGLTDALETAGLDAPYRACFAGGEATPRAIGTARAAYADCAAWLAQTPLPEPVP